MKCVRACSKDALKHGSAVVVRRVPTYLRSADAMCSLRRGDLVSLGEPGRVVDRRPKDVWVVRFRAGTFLIDRDCIEPLLLQENAED